MDYSYLKELDDFFAAQYSDYVRIAAIEGYRMPEMIYVGTDGNITRRDSAQMRLIHQKEKDVLIKRFKEGLADTDFTFSFSFPPASERFHAIFRKPAFARVLPAVLKRYDMTAEKLGTFLSIEPVFWKKIVKGKLNPEKNTLMAIALVCRMSIRDVNNLFGVCGFSLAADNVRDIVFEYLITQKIFNEEMRDRCLAEYRIESIPIAAKSAEQATQTARADI